MAKDISFTDNITSKKEVALTLAGFGIGTIFAVVALDWGTVALGVKEVVSLPSEIHAVATTMAVALLGYIIGKKT